MKKIKGRPAESAGVAGAVAGLIGLAAGLPSEAVAYAAIVFAALPAVVTWVVSAGGVVGLARRVLYGEVAAVPPEDVGPASDDLLGEVS